MVKERSNLGFSDVLEDINPDEWKIKKLHSNEKQKALVTQAALASGFQSRESKKSPANIQRRRRTGRNMQFNLKASPETIKTFCNIADQQGWGLGETLEKAVHLLEINFSK